MALLVVALLLMGGCGAIGMPGAQVEIDWVDFVHLNDEQYTAMGSEVIAGPEWIGAELGEVAFNVSDNVKDSSYRTKNGDAAFRDVGTPIFEVIDSPGFVAVQDAAEVHGYRIYRAEAARDAQPVRYRDMDFADVVKVEFHEGYTQPSLRNTLTEPEEIDQLLAFLDDSQVDSTFSPAGQEQFYTMVFYRDAPLAQSI
ncbi:hypothetical protein [Planomicrobium sp. YIM 101495]|uniref:hypothetical protein n=1 Tax=Planomicrobium sp. YIM 101495 TaxID=2665160 RepID=UPI0012B8CCA0|nr:hypothetical protein [Planomicrobium sp. YIM 101495]MTD31967.1 hypothetical protein [Planomicrobium sp. YIM 101495]